MTAHDKATEIARQNNVSKFTLIYWLGFGSSVFRSFSICFRYEYQTPPAVFNKSPNAMEIVHSIPPNTNKPRKIESTFLTCPEKASILHSKTLTHDTRG
jgi:hypothetical protein